MPQGIHPDLGGGLQPHRQHGFVRGEARHHLAKQWVCGKRRMKASSTSLRGPSVKLWTKNTELIMTNRTCQTAISLNENLNKQKVSLEKQVEELIESNRSKIRLNNNPDDEDFTTKVFTRSTMFLTLGSC